MSMDYYNSARPGAYRALTAVAVGINLLGPASKLSRYAGPCTTEIARVEQKIHQVQASAPPGGCGRAQFAPRQSVGAQLHHQPTVHSVQGAESKAGAEAAAALDRARKADAAGECEGLHGCAARRQGPLRD